MGRSCCVPGCKSNYNSGPYVSSFKFPVDQTLREKWLNNIHRDNWVPTHFSVVCIKHFDASSITYEDTYPCADGSHIRLKRNHPRLTCNAVPRIFPNHPFYCSPRVPGSDAVATEDQAQETSKRDEREHNNEIHFENQFELHHVDGQRRENHFALPSIFDTNPAVRATGKRKRRKQRTKEQVQIGDREDGQHKEKSIFDTSPVVQQTGKRKRLNHRVKEDDSLKQIKIESVFSLSNTLGKNNLEPEKPARRKNSGALYKSFIAELRLLKRPRLSKKHQQRRKLTGTSRPGKRKQKTVQQEQRKSKTQVQIGDREDGQHNDTSPVVQETGKRKRLKQHVKEDDSLKQAAQQLEEKETCLKEVRVVLERLPDPLVQSLSQPRAKKRPLGPARRRKNYKHDENSGEMQAPDNRVSGRCVVCNNSTEEGVVVAGQCSVSKELFHEKLTRMTSPEGLSVSNEGCLCPVCTRLLNYMDRMEVELSMLKTALLNCIRRRQVHSFTVGSNAEDIVQTVVSDHVGEERVPYGDDHIPEGCNGSLELVTKIEYEEPDLADSCWERSEPTLPPSVEVECVAGEPSQSRDVTENTLELCRDVTENTTENVAELSRDQTESTSENTTEADHSTEETLSASMCSDVVDRRRQLEIILGANYFRCKVCVFKTPFKSAMLFHLRQHMKHKLRCDFCNVNVPASSNCGRTMVGPYNSSSQTPVNGLSSEDIESTKSMADKNRSNSNDLDSETNPNVCAKTYNGAKISSVGMETMSDSEAVVQDTVQGS